MTTEPLDWLHSTSGLARAPTLSPVSAPASDSPHAGGPSHVTIGIDVGATKIVAGLVDAQGQILHREALRSTGSTNVSGLVGPLVDLVDMLRRAADDQDVLGIGVGTAGVVRWPEGELGFAANHLHRGLKLRARLEERTGRKVVVDNDANVAALSEAAKAHDQKLLFLAVGTGLGSGFLVDGEIVRWRGGYEFGHVVVDAASGVECTCGKVGCLEAVASGRSLAAWATKAVAAEPKGELAEFLKRKRVPVSMRSVIDAASAGIGAVVAEVDAMGERIGAALANNVMSMTPVDRVVVGGGLSVLGRILTRPIYRAANRALQGSRYLSTPVVLTSTHGADAVLIGSGLLAHRQFARTLTPAAAGI